MSLTEVAEAIAERRLSSVEVTGACLARIESQREQFRCIAALDTEAALEAARAADAELAAGRARGSLHGVPLAHKDMYYRRGRVSACGSRIRADYVPETTATVLARLDAAGALDIARLNMAEFALGPTGHNPITDTPRNPWNIEHITGGSSSGPAAAVAGRLVYGALGSDTGGSVRMPAACCGLVGLKATYGLVSRYGAMPLSFSLDHPGPMTRTVADCAAMLAAIAGHDPEDPTTARRAVPDYREDMERGVRGLRMAVPENYFYDPVDPEVARLMEESISVYRRLGARIVTVKIPGIEIANPMVNIIIGVEGAMFHGNWLRTRRGDYGAQTLGRLLPGLHYPATTYLEALNLAQQVLAEFSRAVFERADVLHVPTLTMAVPTLAESDLEANPGFMDLVMKFGHCARPFNYLRLPALSMPAGFTSNGLPAAFQLVGRPFDESLLFRAARAYEREVPWTRMAPTDSKSMTPP